MRYVIASHAMLVVVEIDVEFQIRDQTILSRGYHYGVARAETSTGGWSDDIMAYRGGDSVYLQNSPEILFFEAREARYEERRRSPVAHLGDVHQLVAWRGGLLLCDTRHDRIVFRENDGVVAYDFGNGLTDRHHVNSLFPCGDSVLALLHNRRRRESQVAVLRLDPRDGFNVQAMLSLWDVICHNVYLEGDTLLYNSSYRNELVVVDLRTDQLSRRVSLAAAGRMLPAGHGHAKGLSVSGDFLVIGVSEEAPRHHRPTSQGCLVFLDRASLRIAAIVPLDDLPVPIGNINEVRRLDAPELALGRPHTPSHDWAGLRLARRPLARHVFLRVQRRLIVPAYRIKGWFDRQMRKRVWPSGPR